MPLLPAPAGMIPGDTESVVCANASPRTRGDDPIPVDQATLYLNFSPHPRG